MTKSYFIQLADYNIWANDIFHSWLEQLSDEQWEQPIVSSFNSIAETALHVAAAETVWLDRLNKEENPRWLTTSIRDIKKDIVVDAWKKSSAGLKSFIENFDEPNLRTSVTFKRIDGNTYELLHDQIFAHVLNHSGYHRGQLVTMLRQAGFTDVKSTDMSTFFWTKKN